MSVVPSGPLSATMRPPLPPLALVMLPGASVRASLAVSTTSPAALVPRASARAMPRWLTTAPITSMRPPLSVPRFRASPWGALSFRRRLGVPVSISSTLRPAASSTWPPRASIRPSLRTEPPTSAICPPRLLRNSPWLTSAAAGPPEASV